MSVEADLNTLVQRTSTILQKQNDWANGQVALLAGSRNDPASYDAAGGKTGPLGYYPITNVNGQTIMVPCLDRVQANTAAVAAGSEVAAQAAAAQSVAAASAALAAGPIWLTVAAGNAATVNGAQFRVLTEDFRYVETYTKAGAASNYVTAVPSGAYVDEVALAAERLGGARAPSIGGRRIIVGGDSGAELVAVSVDGKIILGPLSSEPTVRPPSVGGMTPTEVNTAGEAMRASFFGIPYDPGTISQVGYANETILGRKQVVAYEPDPATLWPARRPVTYCQQGDITPFGNPPAPGIIRVAGIDPDYPVGIVGWRPTPPATGYLDIIIKHGQSNAGGFDGAADGSSPNPKFTTQAPLPGICLTFNGGPHAHQTAGGSGDVATPIAPDRYTSFINMVAGEREGQGLGAAEVYAAAMGLGTKVLLINNAFSGSTFNQLVKTAGGADAQPWADIKAMVAAAVTLANAMGLTARVRALIWNQGEANSTSLKSTYAGYLATLRTATNELLPITGQTTPIVIFAHQPASTSNLSSGNIIPASLAISDWASVPANNAVAVPLYWTPIDDVATVHHRAQAHRYIDELTGHLIWEWGMYGRARCRTPRMIAARRTGNVVEVTMSEPVIIDANGVTDPGAYGISYRDSTASRAVSGVTVDGTRIRFTVEAPTGVGEYVSIAAHGAKKYPALSNRDGLGRLYGLRACIRSPRLLWSHTTGRPLFLWAQMQEFPASISA